MTTLSNNLSKKNVLITGASRGLGQQIASAMWEKGANLILIARSKEKLETLRDELMQRNDKKQQITLIAADLSQPETALTLLKRVPCSIDILINNAAIHGPIGPVWESDWQQWETTLQVDLMSPIALCRAVLPAMREAGWGKIINFSGGGATSPRPNFSSYAVAKTGLVRFSEILAKEVKSFHIDVNCIAPGVMNTTLLAEIIQAGPERVGIAEYTQVQKQKENADINIIQAVKLCLFLASKASDGITGKLISAIWDPWTELPRYIEELRESDIYTLRRIVPKDRGKDWGEPQ